MFNKRQAEILATTLASKDASFEEYLIHASKINLFIFTDKWEESTTEGPLYIYTTATSVKHKLIILNTMRNNHLTLDLDTCAFYFLPNLIVLSAGRIYGLTFADAKECAAVRAALEENLEVSLVSDELADVIRSSNIKRI